MCSSCETHVTQEHVTQDLHKLIFFCFIFSKILFTQMRSDDFDLLRASYFRKLTGNNLRKKDALLLASCYTIKYILVNTWTTKTDGVPGNIMPLQSFLYTVFLS